MGGHGKQIKIRLLKKPRGPKLGVDPSLSNVGGVETPMRALNSVQVPVVLQAGIWFKLMEGLLSRPHLEEKMLHHRQDNSAKLCLAQTTTTNFKSWKTIVPQGHLVNDVPSSSLNLSNAPSVTRRIDVQGPRLVDSKWLQVLEQPMCHEGLGLVDSKWLQVLEQPLCHEVMWNAGILKMPTSHLQHEIISNASVLGKRSIAEMTIPSVNGPARSEMGLLLSGVSQKVGEVSQKAGPI
ncbi:hypothetical protein Tco_1369011 [Tanacetum coccineum]